MKSAVVVCFCALACFLPSILRAFPSEPSLLCIQEEDSVSSTIPDHVAHLPDTTAPVATEDSFGASIQIDDSSVVALPHSSAPLPLPGAADWIINLPGDWWDWGRNTLQVKWLPLAGVIAATTTAAVITDADTYQPLRRDYLEHPWFREASDYAVWIGDGKFQFGLAGLFAAYGFVFSDTVALRTASQTAEVILACGGVVQLLKHLTGREAPFTATTPTGRWALLPNQIEYHKHVPHYDAYPSGHLATALATLTVIAENYPEQKWIRWIGYPALGALTVGMVAQGIHWWSDYPLSIALGYSFGLLVSHRDDPAEDENASQSSLLHLPDVTFLSDGTPALSMSWKW